MISDKIVLKNIKDISRLSVKFDFPESNIIVITGKNGAGKTSLIKSYHLLKDPQIFTRSSGLNAVTSDSKIRFELEGFKPYEFTFNKKVGALDSTDTIPLPEQIIAELPVPFGERFNQFSLIAKHDAEIRANIASSQYNQAKDVADFLAEVYSIEKFENLKVTQIKKFKFYFLLRENDFYIREDHFSSGEYFLIQLFRLITSGAKLILIDEMDVALDAAAQVRVYGAIKPLLQKFNARLVVISHSLAFMGTVEDGALYYLEDNGGKISLESRSYGYIKSDLYGFIGHERYILTEDKVLEGFVEYLMARFSVVPYYQHVTIGLGGFQQLKMIVEKNDKSPIFSDSKNVICLVDRDSIDYFDRNYKGPTLVLSSPVTDIEIFIFSNREELLPDLAPPPYKEAGDEKKASKSYWKWLTVDKNICKNKLYKMVVDKEFELASGLADQIREFLTS